MPMIHGPFIDTYDYKALITQSANEPLWGRVDRMDEPKPKQKRIQRINKPKGRVRGK